MAEDLPRYFFRIRDNGATCFRVETDTPRGRIEMEPIAQLNTRNGEVRVQGQRVLSAEDRAEIDAWMTARQALLARRDLEEIHGTLEQLNRTAHWAQSKASDAELDELTDALLLAMHDLRSVLVRKKADRLTRK